VSEESDEDGEEDEGEDEGDEMEKTDKDEDEDEHEGEGQGGEENEENEENGDYEEKEEEEEKYDKEQDDEEKEDERDLALLSLTVSSSPPSTFPTSSPSPVSEVLNTSSIVLNISSILSMICSHLRPLDLVWMMQVSRSTKEVCNNAVWNCAMARNRDVKGVLGLLQDKFKPLTEEETQRVVVSGPERFQDKAWLNDHLIENRMKGLDKVGTRIRLLGPFFMQHLRGVRFDIQKTHRYRHAHTGMKQRNERNERTQRKCCCL
jgi:hypothetical protein